MPKGFNYINLPINIFEINKITDLKFNNTNLSITKTIFKSLLWKVNIDNILLIIKLQIFQKKTANI